MSEADHLGSARRTGAGITPPDISVIIAVYNTMPYLTKCLTSLVEQSIDRKRMEIVAVDDGSTDGSGEELDRFASRYPGMITVIHQPNSGGPAVPSNRALERATGRYVFFVGADDYLGREALERLVSAADRYGSDVVLGKLVGVNGRYVHQAAYARTAPEIGLFDSALPWALSNTKLFRRELIERYGLRFPEDLPVASDQPFTIEACLRAERISVLADYDFYYLVRRTDASNITFGNTHERHLHAAEAVMTFVADRVPPGKDRDVVLVRHFTWELGKLLMDDFLDLDREVQQRVRDGIKSLADRYLTDDIRHQLDLRKRLRLSLAQHGDLDDLLALIRYDVEHPHPPVVVEGDRCYAAYPAFRDSRLDLPDAWFDTTEAVVERLARFEVDSVTWTADSAGGATLLAIAAHNADTGVPQTPRSVRATAGELTGTVDTQRDESGTRLSARFDLDRLLASRPSRKELLPVRVQIHAFGVSRATQMRTDGRPAAGRLIRRVGTHLYVVTPVADHRGRLVIAVTPVTARRVVGRLLTRLRRG